MPGNNPSQFSPKRDAVLQSWRTKQKQLADYTNKIKRAKQRTLDEWPVQAD